jgi:hypothetical protein
MLEKYTDCGTPKTLRRVGISWVPEFGNSPIVGNRLSLFDCRGMPIGGKIHLKFLLLAGPNIGRRSRLVV